MERATGMQCMSTSIDVSASGKLNKVVTRKAKAGRNTILRRLSPEALAIFVYFLPYRETPSMKMATVEVEPPSM